MDYYECIINMLKNAKARKIEQHSLCVDAMRRGDHKAAVAHMTSHAFFSLQVQECTQMINSHLYHARTEVKKDEIPCKH